MKFKVVPPARGMDVLATAGEAVPLVPDDEESCCVRVTRDTDIASRDEAAEWLTFCRALGLVAAADDGYHRVRDPPDRALLADRFRERVYGADDVLAVLGDAERPLTAGEVYERFDVPAWERRRHADPDQVWAERVARLLEWATVLGLAEREGDRYHR